MKEFTMEVRDIYGSKLYTYIIEAENRENAFTVAQQYSERDFPKYQTIDIHCIKEEPLFELLVKESEIDIINRALSDLSRYFRKSIERCESAKYLKKYFETKNEIVCNLYLKIIEIEGDKK